MGWVNWVVLFKYQCWCSMCFARGAQFFTLREWCHGHNLRLTSSLVVDADRMFPALTRDFKGSPPASEVCFFIAQQIISLSSCCKDKLSVIVLFLSKLLQLMLTWLWYCPSLLPYTLSAQCYWVDSKTSMLTGSLPETLKALLVEHMTCEGLW